jgi:tetratricopeptide (TPR) repeat protein
MRPWLLLLFSAFSILAPAQEIAKTAITPLTPEQQAKAQANVQILRDANDLLSKGDYDGALAKVTTVLQADPRSVSGYVLRGAIYTQKRMWAKAQSDYETAHLINPHSNIVQFNLAEINFTRKLYDAARPGFVELESDPSDIGDLASYKVFLCDLFAGHEVLAAKELAAFNTVGSHASFYFANAAWDLFHHKVEDARGWLVSASNIYTPQKNGFYSASLRETGYLPLPPPKE